MANWDKLNKEFDDLLTRFSDADWENWESERVAKKQMRRSELLLLAKIQEEKLLLSNFIAVELFRETLDFSNPVMIKSTTKVSSVMAKEGEISFALAA